MRLSDFGWNVLASLIAGILLGGLGKIALNQWKNVVIGIGSSLILALTISVVIYGAQATVRNIQERRETTYLQEKINRYLQGHYVNDFVYGWRINVIKIQPQVALSFYWPEKEAMRPHSLHGTIHSLSQKFKTC